MSRLAKKRMGEARREGVEHRLAVAAPDRLEKRNDLSADKGVSTWLKPMRSIIIRESSI